MSSPDLPEGLGSAYIVGTGNVVVQASGNNNRVDINLGAWLTLVPLQRAIIADAPSHEVELLDPAYQAIPFIGREVALQTLLDWLISPPPIAVTAVVGPGGSGKTRLALELLGRLPASWQGGFVTPREARRFVEHSNLSVWSWQLPTLIVMDYAALQAEVLTAWLEELAMHDTAANPLRILLLERHANTKVGWYRDIRGKGRGQNKIERLFFPLEPLSLKLSDDLVQRRTILKMGIAAAQSFHPGKAPAEVPEAGCDERFDQQLAAANWSTPLLLLMAAITSFTEGLSFALSRSRQDLAKYVAENEVRRIEKSCQGKIAQSLLTHLYACITLCGVVSLQQANEIAEEEFRNLRLIFPGGTGAAVHLLRDLLGSTDSLPPLTPDLLAEAFILNVLSGAGDKVIRRMVTVAPHHVAAVLVRILQDFGQDEDPLPLEWIKVLLEEGRNDSVLLSAINEALPERTVALRELALQVSSLMVKNVERSIDAGLAHTVSVPRAHLLQNLSIRQNAMGKRQDALMSISEAVAIYRRLSVANVDGAMELALSLNTMGMVQDEAGDYSGAVDAATESVAILNALRGSEAVKYDSDLAMALNTLGNAQSNLGHHRHALFSYETAVHLHRPLAERNPTAYTHDLARSLNNLSLAQSAMGDTVEALASISEAVALYRPLAQSDPDAFRPSLAMALNNFSNWASDAGMDAQGLESSAEAVSLYRLLAESNSKVFLPDVAMALNNHSNRLATLGRNDEALAAISESVDIRRELSRTEPELFLPGLALSLTTLARRQDDFRAELKTIDEAIGIYSILVEENPYAILPNLARLFVDRSLTLTSATQHEAALEAIIEAVRLYNLLDNSDPAGFRLALVKAFNVAGACLATLGRVEDAKDASVQALHCLEPLFGHSTRDLNDLAGHMVWVYIDRSLKLGLQPDANVLNAYHTLFRKDRMND